MEYKILVVGSGAREHAIVKALNRSTHKKKIYCLASNFNPGISQLIDELIVLDIITVKKISHHSWGFSGFESVTFFTVSSTIFTYIVSFRILEFSFQKLGPLGCG